MTKTLRTIGWLATTASDVAVSAPVAFEDMMPASPPVWSARHLVCRGHGCDLAVMWRPDGRWAWTVAVAGEQVASGLSRSQEGAQDAAVDAARRHSDDGGKIQLPLL